MYNLSGRSHNNLKNIHPDLVTIMTAGVRYSPIDFSITDGVRTAEQQNLLYQKGRTLPGSIVTNCDGYKVLSNHQIRSDGFGYAVDLYPFVGGKVRLHDAEGLAVIALHLKSIAKGLGIKLYWGGDWKIKDMPHFSLLNG